MNQALVSRVVATLVATLLAGCGGGGDGSVPSVIAQQPQPQPTAQKTQVVSVSFHIVVPTASGASARRVPNYVSSATQSASITVAPSGGSAGAPTVVTCTTVCSGAVSAPVGSDTFAIDLYDATKGAGNLLSTGTVTQTIVANTANTVNVTFNGVVASLAIALGAGGTAGTAASIPLTLSALDADGKTIVGPGVYVNASGAPLTVTLSDTDATGATVLSATSLTAPTSGITLSYSGLAIVPATIGASTSGVATNTATFTPTLQPITTNAPLNGATPEIALTAATPGGTLSFTASEIGWTNAPFSKTLTATQGPGCTNVGTTAPATGTTFTTTVAGAPLNGSCTLTLTDFTGGNSAAVTLAYVHGSQVFTYTGGAQNFVVPFGVTQVTIAAFGATGGAGSSGGGAGANGGSVSATLPIAAPQETLAAFVGGVGGNGTLVAAGLGGFGGGASGSSAGCGSGGGGGASDVREGGAALSDRVVVAGAGGGSACTASGGTGGTGGTSVGESGGDGFGGANPGSGGGGGGLSLAFNGGLDCGTDAGADNGVQGTLGTGGVASSNLTGCGGNGGAGGGGGYYGGGGGGQALGAVAGGGGGGGGSSFVEATAISVPTNTQGTAPAGNGSITINW